MGYPWMGLTRGYIGALMGYNYGSPIARRWVHGTGIWVVHRLRMGRSWIFNGVCSAGPWIYSAGPWV